MTSQPAYTTETPAPARSRTTVARSNGRRVATPAAAPANLTLPIDDRLPGIQISLELITPELAEHYLAKRPTAQAKIKQRSESNKTADRYTNDMLSLEWPFTGDPIRFNTLGELIDGQHRLIAIHRSGLPQLMLVIRGLEPETFVVFDTGRPRSFTDALKSLGVANVSIVAGVTRRILYWQRGNYGVPNVARIPNAPYLGMSASASMLLDVFNANRVEIQAASRRGNSFKASGMAVKTAAPAVVGFVFLLLSRIDLERCEKFFHELQFGPSQPGPEYPIFVLRERLRKRVPDYMPASPDWAWIHFFMTTWNRWVAGESMSGLKIPSDTKFSFMAKPVDLYAAERPEGWDPLGGVAG